MRISMRGFSAVSKQTTKHSNTRSCVCYCVTFSDRHPRCRLCFVTITKDSTVNKLRFKRLAMAAKTSKPRTRPEATRLNTAQLSTGFLEFRQFERWHAPGFRYCALLCMSCLLRCRRYFAASAGKAGAFRLKRTTAVHRRERCLAQRNRLSQRLLYSCNQNSFFYHDDHLHSHD